MTRARDESKQETREALIEAAARELGERGVDGASLDAICARAGFTRGAFYVHFRDRDDLLVAVVDRVLTRFQARLLPAGGADLAETIRQFVALVAGGDGATVGTAAWQFRHTLAACARVPALRERYVAIQRRGAALVTAAAAAGQRAGTVRGDVDAAAIGEILVLLSLGISAATEVGMPFDLAGGGGALERLVAAPAPPAAKQSAAPRRARTRPPAKRASSPRARRRA